MKFWSIFLTIVELNTVAGCLFGKFGIDCIHTCHCLDGADCNDTSGQCVAECAPGWDGPSCQRENIAYGRSTSQKEGTLSQNSSNAVDDSIRTCSASKSNVPGWWSVTLDYVTTVRSVVVRTDSSHTIQGWKIYVGKVDNPISMELCTTIDVFGSGTTAFCDTPIEGKYIRVVNRKGSVNICDFQLKECMKYWFGEECENTCNCEDHEEVCDDITGKCKTGCSPGWVGSGCQTACSQGYGPDCKFQCGHCAPNTTCNHVTGTCPQGCEAGWTGMFCTSRCDNSKHGSNCNTSCGHCYGIDSCDVTTECKGGYYGRNCSFLCGHCKDGTVCDHKIGICPSGCKPGWQGVFCTVLCDQGYYGEGCKTKCNNCYENKCSSEDGRCLKGCSDGYIGQRCNIQCSRGTYGRNCSSTCGNCTSGDSCDATTGYCESGCIAGYQQPMCTKLCAEGYYGINCEKCGVCEAGTTCDPFTGYCPAGCGFNFFGEKCMQSEPFSDEDGPQLAIFLGFMIATVGLILSMTTLCLVLIWRREHLLDLSEECNKSMKDNMEHHEPSAIEIEDDEASVFI
ncbi:hypothetical protein ACF0H5_005357 [Mactra antiquata]